VVLRSASPQSSFLGAAPASARSRSHTAVGGFKDDFASWKSTLSSDEKDLLLKQAQNEFDKKFRKSDDYSKSIAEDKIESFSKILQKFFDSEMEEYEKEAGAKTADYTALQRKAAMKVYDFSLTPRISEIDRDADRRFEYVSVKTLDAVDRGELFPASSPLQEVQKFKNDDEESHQGIKTLYEQLEKISKQDGCPKEVKAEIEEELKKGVPPMGTPWEVVVDQAAWTQIEAARNEFEGMKASLKESLSEAEYKKWEEESADKVWEGIFTELLTKYYDTMNEVETYVSDLKNFFKSQKEMPGKTKADILKSIWAELPKHSEKPVPPLDEEMLAELAAEPAVNKEIGEFKHNWGTSDMLYKSEAIDSFGLKYVLGVFEPKEECVKAFDAWEKEYEKAGEDMKDELVQWGKTETAYLEEHARENTEIVMKGLEEARR